MIAIYIYIYILQTNRSFSVCVSLSIICLSIHSVNIMQHSYLKKNPTQNDQHYLILPRLLTERETSVMR